MPATSEDCRATNQTERSCRSLANETWERCSKSSETPATAIQYEIGNPAIAAKLAQRQLTAALHAPLRVVLFEDDEGRAVVEYDRPVSFFGQFGDGPLTTLGSYLDATLDSIL